MCLSFVLPQLTALLPKGHNTVRVQVKGDFIRDQNGLSVDGIEVNWFAQSDKHSNRLTNLLKSGVRQCDTAAHAG